MHRRDESVPLSKRPQAAMAQRLLILGVFAPGQHLTAEDVHERVNALSPVVNISTIYRTRDLFREIGLLSEARLGGGARLYELREGGRHHHRICRACGQMVVLDDDLMRDLCEIILQRYQFEARVDHLALFGRCDDCRRREEATQQPQRGATAP